MRDDVLSTSKSEFKSEIMFHISTELSSAITSLIQTILRGFLSIKRNQCRDSNYQQVDIKYKFDYLHQKFRQLRCSANSESKQV